MNTGNACKYSARVYETVIKNVSGPIVCNQDMTMCIGTINRGFKTFVRTQNHTLRFKRSDSRINRARLLSLIHVTHVFGGRTQALPD